MATSVYKVVQNGSIAFERVAGPLSPEAARGERFRLQALHSKETFIELEADADRLEVGGARPVTKSPRDGTSSDPPTPVQPPLDLGHAPTPLEALGYVMGLHRRGVSLEQVAQVTVQVGSALKRAAAEKTLPEAYQLGRALRGLSRYVERAIEAKT